MGITPRQVDHLFISIYSLIIHLEISIQNISLVLSCEPQVMLQTQSNGQLPLHSMRNVSNPYDTKS